MNYQNNNQLESELIEKKKEISSKTSCRKINQILLKKKHQLLLVAISCNRFKKIKNFYFCIIKEKKYEKF